MTEQWREVFGYEGLYSVSNKGLVRRDSSGRSTRKGRIVGHKCADGYSYAMLSKDGKFKRFPVHSLVARAFIGIRPDQHDVNHKDANKDNNMISNLEYITRIGNIRHAHRMKRFPLGEDRPNSKFKNIDVLKIRDLHFIKGISQNKIAQIYKLSNQTINSMIAGRTWKQI